MRNQNPKLTVGAKKSFGGLECWLGSGKYFKINAFPQKGRQIYCDTNWRKPMLCPDLEKYRSIHAFYLAEGLKSGARSMGRFIVSVDGEHFSLPASHKESPLYLFPSRLTGLRSRKAGRSHSLCVAESGISSPYPQTESSTPHAEVRVFSAQWRGAFRGSCDYKIKLHL